jgi:hypothetical protein
MTSTNGNTLKAALANHNAGLSIILTAREVRLALREAGRRRVAALRAEEARRR